MDDRLLLKMLASSRVSGDLGPVVLAPNVQHEDAGDEEKGHHQDGHWATEKRNFIKPCLWFNGQ